MQVSEWMRLAGLTTWIDAIGNVHGVLGSRDDAAPAIVVGSHYDTVRDAGKYDGALGIISAIAAAKALVLAHVAAHVALEDVIGALQSFHCRSGYPSHVAARSPSAVNALEASP